MAILNISKDLMAPLDSVWEIVGNPDREPEFWHGTKSVKNISKEGNTIEREVIIAFRNSVCREIVRLDPKKRINVEITSGPMRGTRTTILTPTKTDITSVTVQWDVQFPGLYRIFTGMIKKHIHKGTEEALDRISNKLTTES